MALVTLTIRGNSKRVDVGPLTRAQRAKLRAFLDTHADVASYEVEAVTKQEQDDWGTPSPWTSPWWARGKGAEGGPIDGLLRDLVAD